MMEERRLQKSLLREFLNKENQDLKLLQKKK